MNNDIDRLIYGIHTSEDFVKLISNTLGKDCIEKVKIDIVSFKDNPSWDMFELYNPADIMYTQESGYIDIVYNNTKYSISFSICNYGHKDNSKVPCALCWMDNHGEAIQLMDKISKEA